jgi:predicted aspartyl protease
VSAIGVIAAWSACAIVLAQGPSATSLPVERASNVFFVRVHIGDTGPFWFTVDTGATLTVIDPAAAARAGLVVRAAGQRPNVGVGEDAVDLSTTSATIRIDGLPDFSPPFLYVMPVQAGASVLGHAIDGVLGTEVLRRYVVEFDYTRSRVTLHRPAAASGLAAGGVPITLDGNVLLAPATLAFLDGSRLPARILVDTGSNGSLTLTTPFVRRHSLATRFRTTRASAAIGVNGMSVAPVIDLVSLAFGHALIRAPEAALSSAVSGLHASGDFDGILGAELLRRADRLVIDYPGRRLRMGTYPFSTDSGPPVPGLAGRPGTNRPETVENGYVPIRPARTSPAGSPGTR